MTTSFGDALKAFYEAYITAEKAVGGSSFFAGYAAAFFHGTFEGLSSDEIEQIRTAQGVERLPRIYTEFLRVMGRKSGGIFTGCDVDFPAPLSLKQALTTMIDQNRTANPDIPLLPADAVVFYACQGADFCYFRTVSKDDDPAVFYYVDGSVQRYMIASSLSKWLLQHGFNPSDRGQLMLQIDELRNRLKKG